MQSRPDVRTLMPLMREFGDLARKRVGVGVTPLGYQRFLDLKSQIGRKFPGSGSDASVPSEKRSNSSPTRLIVDYASRAVLIASIVENIRPAGLLISTPFAAEVGTRFLMRVSIGQEGDCAEFPAVVVTSMTQGPHTLSTMSMGMSVKFEKMNSTQRAGVSKIFAHELDQALGWVD